MKKVIEYIKNNYWLLAILLGASILRLFRLDFQSVWMDEIYTLNVSDPSLTFKEMHDEVVLREGFPYLYFILLRGFYAVLGYTEVVARLVSALAGIAGVGAIYIFGKNIFNRQVGLIAAFLLAINEFHIAASQEARPYTLFVLFALICFYRLSVFIKRQTLKNALWFGLSAGLMLNINFFALITLFAQGLILLLVIVFSAKEHRAKLFLHSILAGGIALLLFAPNYEIFIKLMNFKSFWVPFPADDSYSIMFREFLGNSEITRFIFWLVIFYYIVSLFREKPEDIKLGTLQANLLNYSFLILFLWFMSYFGLLYAKSYYGTSLVLSRYFITLIPVMLLVLATGIYLIHNRVAKAAVIIAILFFAQVNLIIAKRYYSNVSKSQYREVSAFIKENNPGNIPVYTSLKYWYGYFLERDNKLTLRESSLEDKVKSMMLDPSRIKSFWYADAHLRPYKLSPEAQEFLDKNFVVSDSFEGFDAWTRFYEPIESEKSINLERFGTLKAINGTQFNYNIEVFEREGSRLKISGWAYFDNQDAAGTKISLVLIKNGEAEKLTTIKRNRPDLNDYFKLNYNIENSGFTVDKNISKLAPGLYKLGIHIVNKGTNKEGLSITDKTIMMPL